MNAMAASLGAHPDLFRVQVLRTADGWHRRVKLGAFGYWQPEGCTRLVGDPILQTRGEPPGAGVMCPACWPVWPPVRR
jgi:hypothetical protein